MSYTYSIHPQFNLFWVERSGAVSAKEVRALMVDLKSEPQFNPDFVLLNDFRRVESFDMGFSEMANVAADAKKLNWGEIAPKKVAFLATSQLTYGMTRMFQTLMAGDGRVAIEICGTVQEVADFLELSPSAQTLISKPSQP